MRDLLKVALGISAVVLLGALAAPASAQLSTTANGPYYAAPSWDQKLTTNRFVILANWGSQAVLDRETGLVWERTPSNEFYSWQGGSEHCLSSNVGGRKGWRLPTIQELSSLVDMTIPDPGPTLPPGHPFIVPVEIYASATAYFSDPDRIWAVLFRTGEQITRSRGAVKVWCVRSAGVVDPQ
jgi:hypothetical protein